MKIESIKVRNFRALKDVTLKDLPQVCIVVGANGSGKSTLFDLFAFLQDSLVHNVRQALARRGGDYGSALRPRPGCGIAGTLQVVGQFEFCPPAMLLRHLSAG